MLIKRPRDIKPSEITPESAFHRRREILGAALAAGMLPAANAWGQAIGGGLPELMPLAEGAQRQMAFPADGNLQDLEPWPNDVDAETTSFEDISGYNNYYEFGTGKTDPAKECAHAQAPPLDRDRGGRGGK